MAYAMFQYLGKSWIESKFAERLEALKHDQAIELRRLRVQIESMLSGTLKLQELEFKVLPEAWSKLDQAYALLRWSTSSLQQYPTLDGMGHTDLLLDPIKKVHGGDKNWATAAKLRDQPEVLQRRFRKSSAVSQLSNPISQTTQGSPRSRVGTVLHARIHSADESSRTFEADLDETGGLDYKASQKHFANPPLHVHAPGVKDGERGPHVARLTSTFRHDKSKKVRMSVKVHDEDEWKKSPRACIRTFRCKLSPARAAARCRSSSPCPTRQRRSLPISQAREGRWLSGESRRQNARLCRCRADDEA